PRPAGPAHGRQTSSTPSRPSISAGGPGCHGPQARRVDRRDMIPDGDPMKTRQAWPIVALLCVFMLINFSDTAMLGMAGTQIADEMGLSPSTYGMVASSFYLPFIVSAIAAGFLATRADARRIIFVLALVWTVAQLSAALVP